jgi:pimeloyl-ACP methyl ester carboxylesterase
VLHGGWQSARTWDPLCAALHDRHRVLALDQRGHGETEWAGDYAPDRWIEDVMGFVQALALPRVTLLGFSLGGTFAFLTAARHPAIVERLAIVDHGPDVVDLLRPRFAPGRTLPPPVGTDPALRFPDFLDVVPPQTSQWELLPRIACPTLLVRAERSDRFPRETAERMAQTIPDCRLVEITGSGHNVLREKPEELIAAVRAFLMTPVDTL